MLRVGACQTPELLGDVPAALACMEEFARRAEAQNVDLLLFPECFLQGYLVEEPHLRSHALDLGSAEFASVLRRLVRIGPTLVFGMIELCGGRHFNTAVVVTRGELVGAYRKIHLMPGERLFDRGEAYPTFALRDVSFGIAICADTRSPEIAARMAAQGARVLLVPSQNMMRREAAERWKDAHHRIRAERARETGMWLVSADVTGERDASRIGYGPTSIIDPRGETVARVPLMTTGMAVADIPEIVGGSQHSDRP